MADEDEEEGAWAMAPVTASRASVTGATVNFILLDGNTRIVSVVRKYERKEEGDEREGMVRNERRKLQKMRILDNGTSGHTQAGFNVCGGVFCPSLFAVDCQRRPPLCLTAPVG